MNPRIKELHLKAGFWASEQLPFTNPEWVELRDEKFAELIVRECISILYTERESPHGSERDFAIVNAALKIQRHFEGE